jgi:kumamolisin
MAAAFGTQLQQVTSRAPGGGSATHRQRTGPLHLPTVLDGVVTAVLGLDNRPQARAQFRVAAAADVQTSYTPPQLGVTVIAAAGDGGSADGANDGGNHADFPASSPHVLGCGGTTLDADPDTGSVTSETVWNNGTGGATGGGVSTAFDRPQWQARAGVPGSGRGVPDVAANADPRTGYQVRVDGTDSVIGGTSAVAPLWAALVARLAQATGRPLGLLAETLYAGTSAGVVPPGFRDVTDGDNGGYSAGPGWDACTGLGVPDGAALLARLQGGTAGGAGAGGASGLQ